MKNKAKGGKMSTWIEIKDPDDIEVDGDDVNIFYSQDNLGSNFITFKKEIIKKLLEKNEKQS